MRVEILTPNKTDVLPFVDNNQPEPGRWARAAIWVGATIEPYVIEYQVSDIFVSVSSPYIYLTRRGILDWPTSHFQ